MYHGQDGIHHENHGHEVTDDELSSDMDSDTDDPEDAQEKAARLKTEAAIAEMRECVGVLAPGDTEEKLFEQTHSWLSKVSQESLTRHDFFDLVVGSVAQYRELYYEYADDVRIEQFFFRDRSLQAALLSTFAVDVLSLLGALLGSSMRKTFQTQLTRVGLIRALGDFFGLIPWGL